MKHSLFLLQIFVALSVTACTRPTPLTQCGTTQIRKAYLDAIYAELFDMGHRNQTNLDRADPIEPIRPMLDALRKSNSLSLGPITADRYDPATGNIDCKVEINLRPTGEFSTRSVQYRAQEDEDLRKTSIIPTGFFAGLSAPSTIIFELRDDADGKKLVRGADGFSDFITLADELLAAKWLSDNYLEDHPGSDPNYKPLDTVTQMLPALGQCYNTAIQDIGSRLENVPDSGSSVNYKDGHTMVDYYVSKTVAMWRYGDPIRLCVVSLPTDCPAGDNRGVSYTATNLRTNSHWTASDSEHECGGT